LESSISEDLQEFYRPERILVAQLNPQPIFHMAGVGTLIKQAQKMQRQIEALQTQLEAKEIEVTSGGGAIRIKINGSGKFTGIVLDPEFLKEDAKFVADTILAAVQEASRQAKESSDAEMQKITSGFPMAGLM